MINFGIVKPGSTIYIPFDTFDGGTGASITMTGLATSDIEVYKNGSVTQRASDSGYTLTDTDGIDIDSTTGIQGFEIDLSDNTTAGFWASGSSYRVVVASVTVDGQTVNFTPAIFTIGYPQAILNTTIATLSTQTSFTLTDGPAEDDALNHMAVIVHDVASKVQIGHAVISDYVGSTRTVTLSSATTFTIAATDNIAITGPMPLQPDVAGRQGAVNAAGCIDSNLQEIINSSASAADLKDFADSGYDPATNKVQGVVLVDTTTTNTDMRGTDSALLAASAPTNFNDLAITASTGLVSVGTNNDKSGYSISGTLTTLDALDTAQDSQHSTTQGLISALNDVAVSDLLTTQMTESYAANGVAPTLAEALFAIHQRLMNFAVSATVHRTYQLDSVSTAFDATLDDATNPTTMRRL